MPNSTSSASSLMRLPPERLTELRRQAEMEKCRRSFLYFTESYCWIETKEDGAGEWAPFRLWPAQRTVAVQMQADRHIVMLKARQIGLTWLCVAFALWLMIFHPISTILLFSVRDEEAKKLVKRLRGMHQRLPEWMRQPVRVKGRVDTQHEIEFGNGSTAQAMTKAGDSYTASLVIIDEADLLQRLDDLLESLKPTVADGGRMILVSRSDKGKPESPFKKIYRAAKADPKGHWRPVFLPWHARPDRTQEWFVAERQAALSETGSLDGFSGNYPETDAEALSPRTMDKRIPAVWLQRCYRETAPIDLGGVKGAPSIPALTVWRLPEAGHRYVVGGDPAQGNPTSDDSAACVLDAETGEQCAELRGKIEMTAFGGYLILLCRWYNKASVMVEENNHGHTVLKHLRENAPDIKRLTGHMPNREGWVSSGLGKTLLYDAMADACHHQETTIHSFAAFTQLASIEGNTLRAPEGQMDDLADGYSLAVVARRKPRPGWGDGKVSAGKTWAESAPKGAWG